MEFSLRSTCSTQPQNRPTSCRLGSPITLHCMSRCVCQHACSFACACLNGSISVEEVRPLPLSASPSPTLHPSLNCTPPPPLQVASLLGTFAHAGSDATLTPIAQVHSVIRVCVCPLPAACDMRHHVCAQRVCQRYGDGDTLTFDQFSRYITKEDLGSKLTVQF